MNGKKVKVFLCIHPDAKASEDNTKLDSFTNTVTTTTGNKGNVVIA